MASLSASGVLSGDRKTDWNPWWILGWYVTSIGWIVYGLWARDFSRGLAAFVVLFLPQELYAISKRNDAFPPLTHVVRNRFPGWFAFPLIFATVAAVSARWAALEWRAVGLITLPVAALGWLMSTSSPRMRDLTPVVREPRLVANAEPPDPVSRGTQRRGFISARSRRATASSNQTPCPLKGAITTVHPRWAHLWRCPLRPAG